MHVSFATTFQHDLGHVLAILSVDVPAEALAKFRDRVVEHAIDGRDVSATAEHRAIDEEGRRSVHPELLFGEVATFLDAVQEFVVVQAAIRGFVAEPGRAAEAWDLIEGASHAANLTHPDQVNTVSSLSCAG